MLLALLGVVKRWSFNTSTDLLGYSIHIDAYCFIADRLNAVEQGMAIDLNIRSLP